MAKRLISFAELDRLEGLVEHYRQLQEHLETIEAEAAFDTSAQGTLEPSDLTPIEGPSANINAPAPVTERQYTDGMLETVKQP